jgi:hypothetical protein
MASQNGLILGEESIEYALMFLILTNNWHYYKSPSSSVEFHLKFLDRMSLFCRILILSPHFDCLVALSAEQSATTSIKRKGEDAVLCGNRPWLRLTHYVLEVVP